MFLNALKKVLTSSLSMHWRRSLHRFECADAFFCFCLGDISFSVSISTCLNVTKLWCKRRINCTMLFPVGYFWYFFDLNIEKWCKSLFFFFLVLIRCCAVRLPVRISNVSWHIGEAWRRRLGINVYGLKEFIFWTYCLAIWDVDQMC